MSVSIVWFRQDLRVDDHPALVRAAERGPVVCIYILDDAAEGDWPLGGAARWWLHHSLESFSASIDRLGARLILRVGPATEVLAEVTSLVGSSQVFATARWEPAARDQEQRVTAALSARGVSISLCEGALLHDPSAIRTGAGSAFKVFTPFWRACQAQGFDAVPQRPPSALVDGSAGLSGHSLASLSLLPQRRWDAGLADAWSPGEQGAKQQWTRFAAGAINDYAEGRNLCGTNGTSALSPHLHFGEISPRRLWHETQKIERNLRAPGGQAAAAALEGVRIFRNEIGWREFAHHVLAHFPDTPERPLRAEFERFPWHPDPVLLRAWERGRTGYPLVDAGMRQLWTTGWMHNRVRMVVASFLVKHLLQPWTAGARWFWDTLVDADLASNTLGWQWTAGCGADAAPYFRIFNPTLQGEKFDASGAYVRRWVPELARLSDRWIQQPSSAPAIELAKAGVEIGVNYPRPIIEHGFARARALEALASIRLEQEP